MSDLYLLPSTTYEGPASSPARGHGTSLNTIIEEEDNKGQETITIHLPTSSFSSRPRKTDPPPPPAQSSPSPTSTKYNNIQSWLSPQSDNFPTPKGFPTPRGMHFMLVPTLPSSPSAVSEDDSNSTHSPAASNNNPWNRASHATELTVFEEDQTESENDEAERPSSSTRNMSRRISSSKQSLRRRSAVRSVSSRRSSTDSRKSLPPLVIPPEPKSEELPWPDIKSFASPVAPTPTATVDMSPAIRHFMHHQNLHLPAISTPPSLDGSLTSEQMALMSAPPTPVIGPGPGKDTPEEWSGVGVQLQPAALATLNALSGGSGSGRGGGGFVHHDDEVANHDHHHEQPSQLIEVDQPQHFAPMEMRQHPARLSAVGLSRHSSLNSEQRSSLEGLTRLEIPSAGDFFANLSPTSRNTWHLASPASASAPSPDAMVPPTSTTAEQFYRAPWNNPSPALTRIPSFPPVPVRKTSPLVNHPSPLAEQVLEVDEDDLYDEGNVPTARPTIASIATEPSQSDQEAKEEVVATEIITSSNPEYARQQKEVALSNLDRTGKWLMAQKAYMGGIIDTDSSSSSEEETDQVDTEAETTDTECEVRPPLPPKTPLPSAIKDARAAVEENEQPSTALSPPQRKKTVRFSELPKPLPATSTSDKFPRLLPSRFGRTEGTYYRAFQDTLVRSHNTDAIINGISRFEALQANRVALAGAHRDTLLGKFQLSVQPQSAKKRMSANVARSDQDLVDDPERLRKEKANEAERQMAPAAWVVDAQKRIIGGRLLMSPAGKKLARQSMCLIGGKYRGERLRILDFGGMSTADWGWHAAHAYPNTKVYTTMLRNQRQLSNANVRGPTNHRTVTVARLTKLPFPDAYFDVVSAREMHSMLHSSGESGADEWEGAMKEIMRVLKPGGHFEFQLMDSDVVNPGPQGNAKSVEFDFALRTLGFDPNPTRNFLGRLDRLGFEGTKRTWMVLPMGARPAQPHLKLRIPIRSSTIGTEFRECRMEALVEGSTDAAAPTTGLAGSWVWERWLLRAEMEKVAGEIRLSDMCSSGNGGGRVKQAGACLDGVAGLIEEGRRRGSGWRSLVGYATKPMLPMDDEKVVQFGF